MDERLVINEDGDFDLDEINKVDPLDDIPWPPPNLSAIDLPLCLLHTNIKARATIPTSPGYERLLRDQPHRLFQLRLPDQFSDAPEPIDFFKLFFTDEVIDILVQNTNLYAQLANARVNRHRTSRYWTPVNRHNILVYLALTIHIGLSRDQNIESYWQYNSSTYHRPMRAMSHLRYTQIKKYFHVSIPTNSPLPNNQWFMKLSPLFENLCTKFKEFCIPSQNVSVDEMMEAFTS